MDSSMLMEVPEWDDGLPTGRGATAAKSGGLEVGGGEPAGGRNKKKSKNKFKPGAAAPASPPGGGEKRKGAAPSPAARPTPPQKKQKAAAPPARAAAGPGAPPLVVAKVNKKEKGGRSLIEQMRARLSGGRFRMLNEELYTQPGENSFSKMQEEPALFEEYHKGFREQTADWPQQPVELCVAWLQEKPSSLVVADFGCGDAQLMDSVPNKVHSLDLVAQREGVVACNMADVPLPDGSVDVVVFCLALMGTDYPEFFREAVRVLRPGGTVWIAEVRSRFTDKPGSEAALLAVALKHLGLVVKARDNSNKMFIILELTLSKPPQGTPKWPELKACIYKRR